MASRETKYTKGLSKRLLSSFRKGKKSNIQDKKGQTDLQETVRSHAIETEPIDNAENLEATILESPRKTDKSESNDAPMTPKRNLRHVLSAVDPAYSGISSNSSTPRAPRFELGGTMSASTDSGIDCSILLSEKSSPEQFVAFTRREAERLRQEQALNGSMLETLAEVDRSFSDSDSEKVNNDSENTKTGGEHGIGELNLSKTEIDDSTKTEVGIIHSNSNDPVPVLKNEGDISKCCNENLSLNSHSARVDGDYVLLKGKHSDRSLLIDVTNIVDANRSEAVLVSNSDTNNEPVVTDLTRNSSHTESEEFKAHSVEDFYMSYYANRTDETKSAEARLRNENSLDASLLNRTHEIVNPIPVTSSSIATHKALPSTSSPTQLFVNENSAFAKCKSLKRSVSDVSKGFFDKLRPRNKENHATTSNDGSLIDEKSFVIKSGFSKLKKFGVRKKKGSSRKRHPSDQALKLFNHLDPGNLLMEEDEMMGINIKPTKSRSPVTKEVLHDGNVEVSFIEDQKVKDNSVTTKSPVYKEVLSESVRNELEASIQRRRSPIGQEPTIEELTTSISQMTTALCASSAESIACICDCKNRMSDPDCCDKRKTPSPLSYEADCIESQNECDHSKVSKSKDVQRTPSPQIFSGCIEVSCTPEVTDKSNNESPVFFMKNSPVASDFVVEKAPHHEGCVTSDSINTSAHTEYSSNILDQSAADSCDDESCDDYCDYDDSECSCEECTDLDCSNCCNVSPNTGNIALLSSSSDSESECSVGGSFEDLTGRRKEVHRSPKAKEVKRSMTSGSSSSSECVTPDKSSPNLIGKKESPFSVSFHEVVCENGDVMYVEESFNDYMKSCWDEDMQQSPSTSAPAASPCVKLNQSGSYTQSTLNQSISRHVPGSGNTICGGLDHRKRDHIPYSPKRYESSNPTVLNLSADSSFTNVSFEGSFADGSFIVRNQRDESFNETLNRSCHESSFRDRKPLNKSQPKNFSSTSLNRSCFEDLNSSSVGDTSFNSSFVGKFHQNHSLSQLNDSRCLHFGQINPNHNVNDSLALNLSKQSRGKRRVSKYHPGASFFEAPERKIDPRLNKSLPFISSSEKAFNRHTKLNRSFHGCSPASSPLDLSMHKQKSPKTDRKTRTDKNWVERHVGQVYSPAKRVLHKNQGLSENDLCKQILDLYVSDAEESGFEPNHLDNTLNSSSFLNTSADCSGISASHIKPETGESSGSEGEQSCLQYGTYVAPRNVVKETNVDDFTTTTVWTCYSGEARTRRLQGRGNSSLCAEDRRKAAFEELNNFSLTRKKKQRKGDNSLKEDSFNESVLCEPQVLSDRTNTTPRLSKFEIQANLNTSLNESMHSPSKEEKEEMKKTQMNLRKLNEKGFDRLTMMHTVHNGRRKVRCLSMDESQNVVKYYPPPKEASRISWGQTISEMDLYRHSPRKTPLKTRPILTQKENTYPYTDDTPSPIVLTRMRKPKSLAKRYKNWPWS